MAERHPDDSWAQVELYRWQHGELPDGTGMRKLDVSAGLEAMARAIEEGCRSKNHRIMPTPVNIVAVLEYCARQLRSVPAFGGPCTVELPPPPANVMVEMPMV